jgi:hypothetical protein
VISNDESREPSTPRAPQTETQLLSAGPQRSLGSWMASAGLSAPWEIVRLSAGLSAAGGAAVAVYDWRAGAIFGVAGLWTTAFLGASFATLVCATRPETDMPNRKRVIAWAVAAKIVLFVVGAILVGWATNVVLSGSRQGTPEAMLSVALPLLAGIHVLPAAALIRQMIAAPNRSAALSAQKRAASRPALTQKASTPRGMQG